MNVDLTVREVAYLLELLDSEREYLEEGLGLGPASSDVSLVRGIRSAIANASLQLSLSFSEEE